MKTHGVRSQAVADTSSAIEEGVYVSKKEIAKRYSVTIGCINNWMRQRRIPFVRLSAQLVRFNVKHCDKAVDRYTIAAR